MKNYLKALLAGLVILVPLATPSLAKTLRWSSAGDVISYDPNAQVDSFTQSVQNMVYDGLVRRNKDLAIEPALATSWEVIEPTRWRFHLRQGVKFHEGQPFNADDVVATIQRQIDPGAREQSANEPAHAHVQRMDHGVAPSSAAEAASAGTSPVASTGRSSTVAGALPMASSR